MAKAGEVVKYGRGLTPRQRAELTKDKIRAVLVDNKATPYEVAAEIGNHAGPTARAMHSMYVDGELLAVGQSRFTLVLS